VILLCKVISERDRQFCNQRNDTVLEPLVKKSDSERPLQDRKGREKKHLKYPSSSYIFS